MGATYSEAWIFLAKPVPLPNTTFHVTIKFYAYQQFQILDKCAFKFRLSTYVLADEIFKLASKGQCSLISHGTTLNIGTHLYHWIWLKSSMHLAHSKLTFFISRSQHVFLPMIFTFLQRLLPTSTFICQETRKHYISKHQQKDCPPYLLVDSTAARCLCLWSAVIPRPSTRCQSSCIFVRDKCITTMFASLPYRCILSTL